MGCWLISEMVQGFGFATVNMFISLYIYTPARLQLSWTYWMGMERERYIYTCMYNIYIYVNTYLYVLCVHILTYVILYLNDVGNDDNAAIIC